MRKRTQITIIGGIFLCLFVLLQGRYTYQLFFLEQSQLFLFGREYFLEVVSVPGGLSQYIGEFFVQFFAYPYIGSLCSALSITLVISGVSYLLKKVENTRHPLFLFEGGIAFFLFLNLLDLNFLFKGIIAFLLCIGCLILYVNIRAFWLRQLTAVVLTLFLFIAAGPASVVFVVTVCIVEWKLNGFNHGKSFLLLILMFLLGIIYYRIGNSTSLRNFKPDAFYHPKLEALWTMYIPWLLLPFSVVANPFLDKLGGNKLKNSMLVVCQLFIWGGVSYYVLPKYDDYKSLAVKGMNYHAIRGEWQKITDYCRENKIEDLLCLNYQNLALAEQGMLADSLFYYRQNGRMGLFVDWNKISFVAMTLQEICYRYGDMAGARRYAFEGNVCSFSRGFPQTLMMLVRTNLVLGEYQIAEKYINFLSKTWVYKDWANEQRRYLYNPKAIEESVEYKGKLYALDIPDHLVAWHDFTILADAHKEDEKLRDYILCSFLLEKNLTEFLNALKYFYEGKDAGKLPLVYQEAIMACSMKLPEVLDTYFVLSEVKERFEKYVDIYNSTRDNRERKEWTSLYFVDSYWFYYHFCKLD